MPRLINNVDLLFLQLIERVAQRQAIASARTERAATAAAAATATDRRRHDDRYQRQRPVGPGHAAGNHRRLRLRRRQLLIASLRTLAHQSPRR